MRLNFMPKTYWGKWSVGLIIAFFLLFIIFRLLVISGQRGGETFFSNPILAALGILMAICGTSAFFTGIVAIVKNKERSVIVFLATIIGLFILVFLLGEILFPH